MKYTDLHIIQQPILPPNNVRRTEKVCKYNVKIRRPSYILIFISDHEGINYVLIYRNNELELPLHKNIHRKGGSLLRE
jgi:hypothetical protein